MLRINWAPGQGLWLITPEEFDQLPMGAEVTCMNGRNWIKGYDYINTSTQFGYMSYGILNPFEHPLKELFTEWYLKQ